jgi:3D (Asp-Asp-Asp) domain-containing protein
MLLYAAMKKKTNLILLILLLLLTINARMLEDVEIPKIGKNIEMKKDSEIAAIKYHSTEKTVKEEIKVSVTAYYNYRKSKFANGTKPEKVHNKKVIALSRDLVKKYEFEKNFILKVDDEVYKVVFYDVMGRGWKKKIDLFINNRKECKEWGVRKGILIAIGE